MAALNTSSASNPFDQTFNLRVPGSGPLPFAISDIDEWSGYAIRIAVNYSSQIGASFILLVVLLLITRKEKRNTAIFALNSLSLVFNVIRSILQILYFTGPFYEFYTYFSEDYSYVPANEFRISIVGDVFTFLLVVCLELSLVLQVRAVCVTMSDIYQYTILAFSGVVAAIAIGARLALTIQNCKAIVSLNDFQSQIWLAEMSLDITVVSICFFSVIFMIKLGMALYERHKMGMKQWGPMHILFVMGGQTLIVPAIFSVLQFIGPVPELGSQVLTVTAIFLPLSAMWASATIEHRSASSSKPSISLRRKLLGNSLLSSFTSGRKSSEYSGKRSDSFSNGMAKNQTQISYSPSTPTKQDPFKDLEKNAGDEDLGVYVGKSVTVTEDGRSTL